MKSRLLAKIWLVCQIKYDPEVISYEELLSKAEAIIRQAQDMTRFLMKEEFIPPIPEEWS